MQNEIFKELLNVFCVVDDILIVGYNAYSKDHDKILRWVMQMCHKENLKLNKDKHQYICIRVLFLLR